MADCRSIHGGSAGLGDAMLLTCMLSRIHIDISYFNICRYGARFLSDLLSRDVGEDRDPYGVEKSQSSNHNPEKSLRWTPTNRLTLWGDTAMDARRTLQGGSAQGEVHANMLGSVMVGQSLLRSRKREHDDMCVYACVLMDSLLCCLKGDKGYQ